MSLVWVVNLNQSENSTLTRKTKKSVRWKKSETEIATLAIIIKNSRKRNQTISAASLQQIKNELKKYYNKDLTERHILSVIKSLGMLVVKEKDPRNGRRSLYRVNESLIEEATITLIKLNNEKTPENSNFEGTLYYPLLSKEKKEFLAIGHKY